MWKTIAGLGMGLINSYTGDKRQLQQQQKLINQQVEAQKQLSKHNQALALEAWDKTNYSAQVKHMKNAGLNIGLMYGSAGQGGQAVTAPSGSVTGGQASSEGIAGMGAQTLAQLGLMKAQKENIEADTKVKEIDAENKGEGGVDRELTQNMIEKAKAETTNIGLKNALARIEETIAHKTKHVKIAMIESELDYLVGKAKEAQAKGEVEKKTIDEAIKQVKYETLQKALDIELTKADIEVTKEQLKKITQEIINLKSEVDDEGQNKRILLEAIKTEFGAGEEAKWLRRFQVGGEQLERLLNILKIGKTKTTKTRTDKGDDWSETTKTTKEGW